MAQRLYPNVATPTPTARPKVPQRPPNLEVHNITPRDPLQATTSRNQQPQAASSDHAIVCKLSLNTYV